jgi:type IV pilus assembly protein PilF
MRVCINKIRFITALCFLLIISACTNTPWHKDQAEIYLNKGISFIELQQYNSALKDLLEAVKYNPNDPKIHYYLGMVYHTKGMKEKAIGEFQQAISLQEDYSEAHNYLGTLYSDDGLWDKAIAEFDKALANPLYDTPSVPLYNAGWAYYSKKDYKNALVKCREALNKQPMTALQPQIEKNIGLIYFDQSNVVEAIQHFKKSVELNSYLYDAHFYLGLCYLKIKDKANAKKAFQAVVKIAPQSAYGKKAKEYLQSIK